jgi:N-acetylmuramic acid 6-phosphate etherase
MQFTTEENSEYDDLERMSVADLLSSMNSEDKKVPIAIEKVIPAIEKLVNRLVDLMESGGRLFYVGAGTSGRLGIVDASECPPTYGVSHDLVTGIMAGGDSAIRKAVEFAEDDTKACYKDLLNYRINVKDMVVGLSASGKTPYVMGGLKDCRENGITTASICCNANSPISAHADFPVEVVVGPEFVTGSTRMKSGTAQKLVLNMISTATMVRLGHVVGNKMVDMQLSNDKLIDRGTKMVMQKTGLDYESAKALLMEKGSVRRAVEANKG